MSRKGDLIAYLYRNQLNNQGFSKSDLPKHHREALGNGTQSGYLKRIGTRYTLTSLGKSQSRRYREEV